MKLTVKTDRNIIEDIEISFPVSLEKLAERIQGECPYRILLARVNGVDRELAEKIDPERDFAGSDELVIEFLDMRTHSAELTYQRGISMIYLKAVKDVLGADAIIDQLPDRKSVV